MRVNRAKFTVVYAKWSYGRWVKIYKKVYKLRQPALTFCLKKRAHR